MGDFAEVDCGVDYYGSDDGYHRHETLIHKIIDKDGHAVEGIWSEVWKEIAAGIETRRQEKVTKGGRQEHVKRQSMRIYRHACPVYVQFRHRYEYVDYDKEGEQSSYDDWKRFEASVPDQK